MNTPSMVKAIANHVRMGAASRRIKKLNPAARTGAVAKAVRTTVIDVSMVAKLKASVLLVVASRMQSAGMVSRQGICEAALRPSVKSHKNIKLEPISNPRQKVSPQLSSPDRRINRVSGDMSSAPASAMARPRTGRGRESIADIDGMTV